MNLTAQRILPGPAALDYLTSLLGITAAWSLATLLAAGLRPLHAGMYLPALALAVAGHLAHHARCRRRPPRVRSLSGVLWAPLGRIRRVPAGTPLLSAKVHRYFPWHAQRPMLVWVGWWNCSTFPGDSATEYFFVHRLKARYAIPAADLVASG